MTVRSALLYLALWSPLVLVYAMLIGGPNGQPVDVAVSGALHTVSVAALLGVPALWWARRVGREQLDARENSARRRFVVAHAFGALVYALAWTAYIAQGIWQALDSWEAASAQMRPWILWQLFFGLVVYAVLSSMTWARLAGERTRQREARLREAEAERARAELAMLRAQVDPHFLYNALHTATALVRLDPAAAEQALEQLASLLRYVLDPARGARESVPLDEELQFVELYLSIERARLGNRLRVVTEVDDEARDVHVPSLSLQPLVENAITHGLAPRLSGGTITVRAHLDAQGLALVVQDDGVGRADMTSASRGTGIGLDALRKRLAARYGDLASLHVETSVGAGFTATVRLPA